MNRAGPFCVLLVLALCLPCAGTSFAQEEQEQAVREMYGQRIAGAKATPVEDDDVELAKELLKAAADPGSTDKLRYALARVVLEMTLPLTGGPATEQASAALEIVDRIQPLPPLDKATVVRDLAGRRLSAARGKRPEEILVLARASAAAHLEFATVAMNEPAKAREVESSLIAARGLLSNFKLTDLKEKLDSATESYNTAKARKARLSLAEQRLKTAQEEGDAGAVKTARRGLAQVYFECDGDLVSAGKYLAGTEDPREKCVCAAAAFLADPRKLDANTCTDTVEALVKLASSLTEPAKSRVAECAAQMCQTYLTTEAPELGAAKARLLMVQLQPMLKRTPADLLRKRLEAAYKTFGGKVEPLDSGRVRVTYDFSDPAQLKDWESPQKDDWSVQKGALVFGMGGKIANHGTTSVKLRFRADKPFRAAFVGKGEDELAADLVVSPIPGRAIRYSSGYSLSDAFGLTFRAMGTSWSDEKARLKDGVLYAFDIFHDGKGKFSWSVGGRLMMEKQVPPADAKDLATGPLIFQLRARARHRSFAAFGNVVLEGEVIIPDQPATAPATRPPATSPPATSPAPVNPAPATAPAATVPARPAQPED